MIFVWILFSSVSYIFYIIWSKKALKQGNKPASTKRSTKTQLDENKKSLILKGDTLKSTIISKRKDREITAKASIEFVDNKYRLLIKYYSNDHVIRMIDESHSTYNELIFFLENNTMFRIHEFT